MQQVGKLGPYRVLRDGWRGGTMSFVRQLNDYRLTPAEILYHLPDHPALLQAYIWQAYDLAPRYPELRRFLDFWHQNLAGTLHSAQVAYLPIIKPIEPLIAAISPQLHISRTAPASLIEWSRQRVCT